MADGMTITGLDELRAAVDQLPNRVRATSRSVAQATALRVQAKARAILLANTKGTGATAALIVVAEEADKQRFLIESRAPASRPANLVLWLEYGSRRRSAIHYMGDALRSEDARYRSEMQAVVEAAVREALE